MAEFFQEILHSSHLTTTLLLGIGVLALALFSHWRGRTGSDDIAFLVLKLYQAKPGEKRRIRACAADTVHLKQVVENLILRIRIVMTLNWSNFWWKTATLQIKNTKLRRTIMGEFRHHLSCMFNKEIVGEWSNNDSLEDNGSDQVRYAFSVSDLLAPSGQRKIRIVVLRQIDLEWIMQHGITSALLSEELKFIGDVLQAMIANPECVSHVGKYLAKVE